MASRPIDLEYCMPPTDPPGFLGVAWGDPTVPKRKESMGIILSN
jgi:hypothetical protein